jgi:tetratricopeptide (TPR) repeat protein
MPIGEAIAVAIIADLIVDCGKLIAGERPRPIERAIAATADSNPGIEGLETTLWRWLQSHKVVTALQQFVAGVTGFSEVPLEELVSAMVDPSTGFYVLADNRRTAELIVRTFLKTLRTNYWGLPQVGIPALGNQLEQHTKKLDLVVDAVGELRSFSAALTRQHERAEAAYAQGDYLTAKTLLESLLDTVDSFAGDTRELRIRVRTNLARVTYQLDETDSALFHLTEALRLDPKSPKTQTNWGVALLIQNKPAEALKHLESIESDAAEILEYWSARAEALVRMGRIHDAIAIAERAPEKDRHGEREHLIGNLYMHAKEYERAAAHFTRALEVDGERPEFLSGHAEALMIPISERINRSDYPFSDPRERGALPTAISEFNKARRGFEKSGRLKKARRVQLLLGVASLMNGDVSAAIQYLQPLSEGSDVEPDLWRNLGTAYLIAERASDAVPLLEKALALGESLNERDLLFSAYILTGKADKGKALAEERAGGMMTSETLHWHLRRSEALRASRHFTEAQRVLNDLHTAFPEDPDVLAQIAEHYDATGEVGKAEEYYRRALESAGGGRREGRIRFLYGGFCGDQRKFAKAVDIWKPLVRFEEPDGLLVRYCIALYNSGQLAEIPPIAVKLLARTIPEKLADLFAATYERLNNLDEAILWLEYLAGRHGNKPDHLVRLAILKFRRGRREEARELLNGTRRTLKDPHELMTYATAYTFMEQFDLALELGLQAIKSAPDDQEIMGGYIALFLAVTKSGMPSPEERYVTAYQDAAQNFTTRFPESEHFRSIKFQPDDVSPILKILDETAKRQELAVEIYNQKRPPLSVFSEMLGRDLYDTWLHVICSDDLALFTAFGTVEEAVAAEHALRNSQNLILDTVGLFTNAFLETLGLLAEHAKVYVEQSLLDELHHLQAVRQVSAQGYMLAGKHGDIYTHYEVSPDEAKKMRAVLDQAVEFVEQTAIVTGLSGELTSDDQRYSRLLGEPNVRTLILAREKSFPFIGDDKVLGELGRELYGVAAVNTQAFLTHLLACGVLDLVRYDQAVIKLVHAGYTHVRLEARQIFRTMSNHAFQITPHVSSLLRAIEAPSVTTESATRVTAELLKMLFIEPLPPFTREAVTFSLLDVLTRNHRPRQALAALRRELARLMGSLLVLQLTEIESYIRRWERRPQVLTAVG